MKALQEYKKKRDFKKTSEPIAKIRKAKEKSLMFVVQEHHASHLHYDFRLEHRGVLKSWSVPKGPSPHPQDKRLAVEVEDHPYDYGSFEGEIPEDEYGGGEVFQWDTGTWEPEGNVDAGLKKGHLDFTLKGKRMKGRWSLIRLHGNSKKPNWLLFKRDDQYADDSKNFVRIQDYGSKKERGLGKGKASVTKDMLADSGSELALKSKSKSKVKKKPILTRLPEFIEPELALLVDEAPTDQGWIHEMKFDGYRIQARIDQGKVELRTRSSHDWSKKYGATRDALSHLKVKSAILDGEICALDEAGRSDFQSLQLAMKEERSNDLVYYVFDLLFLNGEDLRSRPLLERKELLENIMKPFKSPLIRYSQHLEAKKGKEFFKASCSQELEGIISKKADSLYESERTSDWVKTKCLKRQEFVIGGYTDAQGARNHFGALLLGVYENKKLKFVGKCGTGFDNETLGEVFKKLKRLEVKASPFELKSPRERGIHWLKPKLAAEVKFAMWTRDDLLRVPVFQGFREDKDVKQIKREVAEPVELAMHGKMPSDVRVLNAKKAKLKGGEETPVLTHPDKILFAKEKLTKQDIADFYSDPHVAPFLLEQIKNRPLALNRCPAGTKAKCFFQKHIAHLPAKTKSGRASSLHEVAIRESSGVKGYITVDSMAGVLTLVQMGAFEVHAWGARQPDVEHPDQIVMDFDPSPEVPFARVKEAALELKKTLDHLKLKSFLKVTGGKGLHVHIPVAPVYTWDQIKEFSKTLADEMVSRFPGKYTSTLSKSARTGKIFIDYLRNGRSATAVAPYMVRAKEVSAVAIPIEWSELKNLKNPAQFTVPLALKYLKKRKKDPWKGYTAIQQRISILD